MLRSLRTRLLLSTILIVLIAVGVTAVVATRRTTGEFERYQERRPAIDMRRVGYLLGREWAARGDWSGIQDDVEQLAQFAGQRVVLADAEGVIAGDSDGELVGQAVEPAWRWSGTYIVAGSQVIGKIYLDPSTGRPDPEQAFLDAVNRSVMIGALAAGLAALVVTFALAGGILRPIRKLTDAARRMTRGDRSVRVETDVQDEIGELAAAFNTMAGSLEQQEELRRNMVGDVAHELRTPLTNLRGYLEAVRDGIVEPDNALIDSLYDETMLLSRLVSDLQELAQAEAGQLALERQETSLASVVERAATILRPQADAQDLRLDVSVPANLPEVFVDQERIGQVLRNLVNNAIAHTPPGGRISIAAEQRNGQVVVAVRDTGSGISPEHLPHVFDRFYRGDRSRARQTGGAGLGLAIVRQLVEAHGGRVGVESKSGEGSNFWFSLPTA